MIFFCAFFDTNLAILSIQKAFPGLVLGIRKHNQHYIKKYSREKNKVKKRKKSDKNLEIDPNRIPILPYYSKAKAFMNKYRNICSY